MVLSGVVTICRHSAVKVYAFDTGTFRRSLLMDLDHKPYTFLRWASIGSGGSICAISLLVLGGWYFHVLVLTSVLPGMIPMNPAVAVSFLLLGVAVVWQALKLPHPAWQNSTITAIGLFVAAMAILRLAAYLGAANAHIDQLLFNAELNQVPFAPNRMAPDTACGLMFGGIGVAGVAWRKPVTRQITNVAAMGLLLTGLYGIANYLFTIDVHRLRGEYIPTAMHTAVALLLLFTGLIALDHTLPMIRRFIRQSPGGIIMRRLLPPLILLPLFLGWLRIVAQYDLKISGPAASTATSAVFQIVLLGALVWAAAVMMDRLYDQRQQVMEKLQETQKQLLAAKQSAEEAAGAKSQFLANMSHEIRTPLHGVIAMMELLAETPMDEQQRGYTQVAKSSAAALLAVINDILDFSKIEAGRLELENVDFDLRTCTEDTVYMMLPAAMRKKLELGYDLAPDLPSLVLGDPVRLRQVLMNLLSNAIKFTDKGEIWVKLSAENTTENNILARFEVHDTGRGIATEHATKLFTAFAQVHYGGDKVNSGTGLGLAICRQIVELMGGKIDFESRPGEGSTFWFTVQLQRRKAVWLDAQAIPEALHRQRVLLWMVSKVRREKLKRQLQYWKIEVEETADLQSCLDRLADSAGEPVDVLFVEHHPPELNALKVSEVLHAHGNIRAPAIVALARSDTHISADIQRRFGLSGVLSKPVRQSQLFDLLMRLVSLSPDATDVIASQAQPALVLPRGYQGLTALVAEDNEINQFVIKEVLTRLNLQCRIVGDGRKCIEALQSGAYAFVLMDSLMPVMNGYEAAKQIRELEAAGKVFSIADGPRIPIIALTANTSGVDRQAALDAGMDGFLTKPLDRARLVELITELIAVPAEETAMPAVAASADGNANEPFDFLRLRHYFAHDTAMVDRLLGQFIGQGSQQLARLDESMEKRDWKSAARAAHSIKGTAACLFAHALQLAAKDLEVICRTNPEAHNTTAAWRKVKDEMIRCIDYVAARPPSSGTSAPAHGDV
jgi:signal transduction histidine kinase/CheY-like chemotaxis protein